MIRIVLAERGDGDWRAYRQAQWIGEVRRDPDAALVARRHFDMEQPAYQEFLDASRAAGHALDRNEAMALLTAHGAREVTLGGP